MSPKDERRTCEFCSADNPASQIPCWKCGLWMGHKYETIEVAAKGNGIAAQMRRAVQAEPSPPEAELLMLLTNGASEIDRLEGEVKHLRVIKP